ncbi:glutathione transferase GstA [Epibacterium sp. SM1979]|uniref:Glutathione transferase GstA n=1 Tax=Tritonibacter litoralis TaxID=2662264 RepID=A0A843YLI0_9RHOB|nr:glutathione transferase GstA [Tritonibacter litoralis]MQQ10658.1 glutathione transferase GstA [Tritonibacter litoralis]
MKLYYKAGACPLASHIALYEAEVEFDIEAVDTDLGQTETGDDYLKINPRGYVPALRLDDGAILTEGAAVLQYIADAYPQAGLAPASGSFERSRLHEALNWVATELHKAFNPLFRASATEAEKEAARLAVAGRFDQAEEMLSDGRVWLVADHFSVADAYFFAVANWANFTGIALSNWPNVSALVDRVASRPSAQKALKAEGLLQ